METVILFIFLLESLSNKKPVGKTDIQTLQGHPVEVNRKAHKEERIPKWLLIKNDSNRMPLPRIFFLSFWKTRKFKATVTEHPDLAFLSKEVVQYEKYYEAGSSLLGHTNNCGRISKKLAAILVCSLCAHFISEVQVYTHTWQNPSRWYKTISPVYEFSIFLLLWLHKPNFHEMCKLNLLNK